MTLYDRLLKAINQKNKVLFLGEAGTGKSHLLRLLLTDMALKEKLVIDTPEEVDFIKKNFKIDPNITFETFEDILAIPELIIRLAAKEQPFIAAVDVPSIHPMANRRSVFDIFREYLTHEGKYRRKQQVEQLMTENIDLMIVLEKAMEGRIYEFGSKPTLLKTINFIDSHG